MEILVLQVFVSFMLVVGSVLLFPFSCKQKDYEHADRLSLLPIEQENTLEPESCKTKPNLP